MRTTPHKILIMPAAGMGDLIMASPVIRAVRNKFPNSHIAVLAHHSRGAKDIGSHMSHIDDIIDFPLDRYTWTSIFKFMFSSYWPLFWKLKNHKYDTIIILASNPIRTILTKMLRPQNILHIHGIGYHPTKKGLELVSPLGCAIEPVEFGLEVPNVQLQQILSSILPKPWIGIHPFSAIKWRNWNRYPKLIEMLPKSATIFLLGSQKEAYEKVDRDNTIDLVNKVSVEELMALISQLDVLVSIDSGPMHIGFALDVPTVALFGPVPPESRIPLVERKKNAYLYYPSFGPGPAEIKERKSIEMNYYDGIDLEEVMQKITEILSK